MADPALDAAVLMSYGSGNAPADPTLLAGVRALTARGGAVLNITQAPRGAVEVGAYAASQPLARAGAVAGADLTPEAALASCMCCCPPVSAARNWRRNWPGPCAAR